MFPEPLHLNPESVDSLWSLLDVHILEEVPLQDAHPCLTAVVLDVRAEDPRDGAHPHQQVSAQAILADDPHQHAQAVLEEVPPEDTLPLQPDDAHPKRPRMATGEERTRGQWRPNRFEWFSRSRESYM